MWKRQVECDCSKKGKQSLMSWKSEVSCLCAFAQWLVLLWHLPGPLQVMILQF